MVPHYVEVVSVVHAAPVLSLSLSCSGSPRRPRGLRVGAMAGVDLERRQGG